MNRSVVVVIFLGVILAGCGSGGSSGSGGAGGAAGQAATGGQSGAGGAGGGAGGLACAGGAPAGAACGIDSLGTELANCTCPLPSAWTALGGECGDAACAIEGGPCSPQGYASSASAPAGGTVLDGQPCVMNGNVCFTAEASGSYGCVCASTPSGDFVMRCGPVNEWFSNNGTPTTY